MLKQFVNHVLEFVCIGLWCKLCNQISLFCLPLYCVGFLWLMARILLSYLNPDLQGSPSSGLRISKPRLMWCLSSFFKSHSKTKAKSINHALLQGSFNAFLNIISLPLCISKSIDWFTKSPLAPLEKYDLNMRKICQFLSFFMLCDLLHKHQKHHGKIIVQNYSTWENTQVNWPADCMLVCNH